MWEKEFAKKLKEATVGAKEQAIDQSVMTVGTIESVKPLVVSAFGGEGMYMEEDDEIVITRTFGQYFTAKKNCVISGVHGTAVCNGAHCTPDIKKGAQVLIAPVGSLNRIALIDLIGG